MSAVAPVLAAISGGPVDPADARAIASLLSGDVNSPTTGIAPGQNLLLNADFIRRVAERKGPVNGQDQDAARKQIADALKNANVSSSAFAAALGQSGFASAGFFARSAQQSDDAKSGGRFKDINGGNSTGDGSGYSWLTAANQNIAGFSQTQVAGAANFLKGLGLTRAEVNDNVGDMVHLSKYEKEIRELAKRKRDIERRRERGEDVSEDQKKYDEDKNKIKGGMTPEEQRHFNNLPMLRQAAWTQKELRGDRATALDDSQAHLLADQRKAGVAHRIEANHSKVVAELKANPNASQADEDDAVALIKARSHTSTAQAPTETPVQRDAKAEVSPKKPDGEEPSKPVKTAAIKPQALKPTV